MSLLEIDDVSMDFGGVHALDGVDLSIAEGELLGLIGPNGAGKTTLLRVLVGVLRPTSGRILFKGADVTGLPIHRRAQQGIALTHQIVRPFRHMTLIENVMLAAEPAITASPFQSLLHVDQKRGRGRARLRSCNGSALPTPPTGRPPSCRSAISSAWRSRARLRSIRNCCCWTSRWPG